MSLLLQTRTITIGNQMRTGFSNHHILFYFIQELVGICLI